MVKCIFCGKDELAMKGVSVIKNDGSVNYFCSSKCRKNSEKLGRDKRKIRWTESFHVEREKAAVRAKAVAEKAEVKVVKKKAEVKVVKKKAVKKKK